MTLGDYYLAGLVFAAISILGVGMSATAWLKRLGIVQADSAPALLLTNVAAGIYWNTIVFLLVFLFHERISYSLTLAKFSVEFAIIIVTVLLARPQIRDLVRTVTRDGLTLLLGTSGVLLGSWAMIQFPQVLDSGQLIWTQQLLGNGGTLPVSPMMGYSGLVVFLAALFPGTPVVITAAALKPLLFGIYGCVAVYLAECISIKRRKFYAASFFALSLISYFGSYGLIQLGKDSVWGMLFGLSFITTLCREDADCHDIQAALYFAVASTTGVIAVPYIVMFYALWLVLACPPRSVGHSLVATAAVNLLTFPIVLAGFATVRPLLLFGAYVPIALLIIAAHWRDMFRSVESIDQQALRKIASFLPLIFLALCVLLLPFRLKLAVWSNPDGTTIFDLRPPLDGQTDFYRYFFSDVPLQQLTVACGLASAVFIGCMPIAGRQPGFIALAISPLAVLFLALVRIHTGIPIINDFNMWDMIRDIPYWLGGTVFTFLALAGVEAATELPIIPNPAKFGAPLLLVALCIYSGQRALSLSVFSSPVHYNRYAGFTDGDMAVVSSLVWEKFRGYTLWIDPALSISRYNFYSFQMYGVVPATLDVSKISDVLKGKTPKLLLVQNRDLKALQEQVNKVGKHLHYLDVLRSEPASMVLVGSTGRLDATRVSGAVSPTTGAYPTEKLGEFEFNWMQAQASLFAVIPGSNTVCVTLSLFDAGLAHGPQLVHLAQGGAVKDSVDVAGHSPQEPAELRAAISLSNGNAELTLRADAGTHTFPNDARKISYGLLEPIDVAPGRKCSP